MNSNTLQFIDYLDDFISKPECKKVITEYIEQTRLTLRERKYLKKYYTDVHEEVTNINDPDIAENIELMGERARFVAENAMLIIIHL